MSIFMNAESLSQYITDLEEVLAWGEQPISDNYSPRVGKNLSDAGLENIRYEIKYYKAKLEVLNLTNWQERIENSTNLQGREKKKTLRDLTNKIKAVDTTIRYVRYSNEEVSSEMLV